MKLLMIYETAKKKLRENWNVLSIVACPIAICIFSAYYSNQFSYDDGYLTERFVAMIDEYGIFRTIIREFLNMDLADSGEMRFYGLSKVIHIIVFLFAGEHVRVYQFIMTSMHFAMGALLYRILNFFNFDNITKFMCVCVWCFSPFAHVQTFHHFSYLFLPLYFVMGYSYINLLTLKSAGRKKINVLLIFCCIFTGENTIPLLGLIMLSFILWGVIKRNTEVIKKYISHVCIAVMFGISWIMLWKYVICEAEGGRFSNFKFSLSKIYLVKRNFTDNFKYFLWLDDYQYRGNWEATLSIFCIVYILGCIGMAMLMFYNYIQRSKPSAQKKLAIGKFSYGALIIFIGMSAIYILLNIFKGYEMSWHYFYTIYTVLFVLFVIFLNYIPNKLIKNGINGVIILILIVSNVFWTGVLLPEYGKRNAEIEDVLKTINGNSTIVVITESMDPIFGKVFEQGKYNRPKSAFSAAWATEAYLNDFCDKIVFAPKEVSISYDDENVYLNKATIICDNEKRESAVVVKNNTYFMYLDYKNDWKISTFDEFLIQNSTRIFSVKDEFVNNIDLMYGKQILKLSGQEERAISGQTVIITEGGNVSEIETSIAYFRYNRNSYGTGEFLYDISNIPKNKNIDLFMDFNDFWSRNPKERIFDIEIEIKGEVFLIEGVDIYDFGGEKPVRIVVKLPQNIESMRVRFIPRDGFDVAMIQAIGLMSQ